MDLRRRRRWGVCLFSVYLLSFEIGTIWRELVEWGLALYEFILSLSVAN